MPGNFSFVIPGKLAGCARPGRTTDLASDLAELATNGVGAVVTLTEQSLDRTVLEKAGFRWLHLPVEDFMPPSRGQVREFVDFVDACLAEGVAVVAHCAAGMGRTGTMLACYLASRGLDASEAIREVRRARPGSIETPDQERCVVDFRKTVAIKKKRKRK